MTIFLPTFFRFYLSFAAILTPAFNVAATYSGAAGSATSVAAELESLCTFLYVWNGAFMVIWIASFKTNLALNILFFGVVAGGKSLFSSLERTLANIS